MITAISAGMDMSGGPLSGHNAFLAVIIGSSAHVLSTVDSLGYDYIHMRRMNKKQRKGVIDRLKIDPNRVLVLCIRIDRDSIISRIIGRRRVRRSNVTRRKILTAYNRLILEQVRGVIGDFLAGYGFALSDVVFECDADCVELAKDVGLKHVRVGRHQRAKAHELADVIAWLNNGEIEPDNVVVMDTTGGMARRLENDFG